MSDLQDPEPDFSAGGPPTEKPASDIPAGINLQQLLRERDHWKAQAVKFSESGKALKAKYDELRVTHRQAVQMNAFKESAAKNGILPEAVDAAIALSKWNPSSDTADPKEIENLIKGLKTTHFYLFRKEGDQSPPPPGNGEQPPVANQQPQQPPAPAQGFVQQPAFPAAPPSGKNPSQSLPAGYKLTAADLANPAIMGKLTPAQILAMTG